MKIGRREKITGRTLSECALGVIGVGKFGKAVLRRFLRASSLYPPVVFRYWYKVVQAVFSGLGLEALFLSYRRARRRLQHVNARVIIGDQGVELQRG